jgi:hypothetical protein
MRLWYKRVLFSVVAIVVLAAVGGIGLAVASGSDPFCTRSTERMESMGPEKARAHQEYCQRRARWATIPPGPKNGPPSKSLPTAEEMLRLMKANAEYGVSKVTPPYWLKAHQVRNAWLGQNHIVYAGAVGNDHSVGVVALADRWTFPVPKQLSVNTTSSKDGALRVVSAAGADITLVAENGTHYTFNIDTRTLTRK